MNSHIPLLVRGGKLSIQNRYSTSYVLRRQSVADHIQRGGLILVLMFSDEKISKEIDEAFCYRYWFLHDLEECEATDIPHSIKRLSSPLTEAYSRVSTSVLAMLCNGNEEIFRFFHNYTLKSELDLPKSSALIRAKSLLEFVDMFEILLYCLEEIAMGNLSFIQIYQVAHTILTRSPIHAHNYPIIQSLMEEFVLPEYPICPSGILLDHVRGSLSCVPTATLKPYFEANSGQK